MTEASSSPVLAPSAQKSITTWENLALGVKEYVTNLQKGDKGVQKRVETMVNCMFPSKS